MNMDSKLTYAMFAVVLVVALGAYFFPGAKDVMVSGAAPTGATFGDAKQASIIMAPATSAASTTSILNNDGSTRYITDEFVACSGTNGQGGTFTMATTALSAVVNGLQGNANSVANVVATTTTTSLVMYTGSTTEGVLPSTSRLWPSGVYLSILDSTINTGACTVGVHYLSS